MSEFFMKGLESESNFTETENGATALKSTNSDLVDLFASIGSLRDEKEGRIRAKFIKAMNEDKLLALKILFYARDVRGGLGERKVPRVIYSYLVEQYENILVKNLMNIIEFGRWDDLFYLLQHSSILDAMIIGVIKGQLQRDMNTETPSLMAKWLPSINTSSKEKVKLAKYIAKRLDVSPKQYRKTLSYLRNQIDVVERKMASKRFSEIEYSKVPSKAMNIYRNAYRKNDETRFENYIESLQKGETKVNASTLYPYDIIEKIMEYSWGQYFSAKYDALLEEQWKALPDYVEGENNVIVMADTSGSMEGRPMHTSLGLAIYFAERNNGYYNNKFMTFSSRPEFVTLKGESLADKIRCIESIVQNTNLEAAFNLILQTAINNNVKQDEMPKSLIVISDMQFDSCQYRGSRLTWHDEMQNRFNSLGYQMPNIVYWNVADRRDSFQVNSGKKGVQLVSGQSTSIFKTLLVNIGKTPYEAMLSTLNNPRYDLIKI